MTTIYRYYDASHCFAEEHYMATATPLAMNHATFMAGSRPQEGDQILQDGTIWEVLVVRFDFDRSTVTERFIDLYLRRVPQ